MSPALWMAACRWWNTFTTAILTGMHWISAVFTVHLRFFAQRVFQGKQEQENDTHDEVFRALIARNCSEHYKCACCIAEYVRNTWHKELSDEELVFLTIHLKRIRMGK